MSAWKLNDWFELIKVLATVATAIVAVIGVMTAREGLHKWRSETLGKRRAEVAEQLLSTAYEVHAILKWARTPAILAGEGQGDGRKADSSESPELRERRNSLHIPIQRLNERGEMFAKLQTMRFTVAALFGEDAVKPINALLEGHRTIGSAAAQLIMNAQVLISDRMAAQGLQSFFETLGLGKGDQPDRFEQKIAEAICSIEAFCRPALDASARR